MLHFGAAMKESPELYAEMYIEMQKVNEELYGMLGDAFDKARNESLFNKAIRLKEEIKIQLYNMARNIK